MRPNGSDETKSLKDQKVRVVVIHNIAEHFTGHPPTAVQLALAAAKVGQSRDQRRLLSVKSYRGHGSSGRL